MGAAILASLRRDGEGGGLLGVVELFQRRPPISLRRQPVQIKSLTIRPKSSSPQLRQTLTSSASVSTRSRLTLSFGMAVLITGLASTIPDCSAHTKNAASAPRARQAVTVPCSRVIATKRVAMSLRPTVSTGMPCNRRK